jgi:hypothetical protein
MWAPWERSRWTRRPAGRRDLHRRHDRQALHRIGDSPIIGAGTYADDRSCAVSATGHGEIFIRAAVAHDICSRMRFGGRSSPRRCAKCARGTSRAAGRGRRHRHRPPRRDRHGIQFRRDVSRQQKRRAKSRKSPSIGLSERRRRVRRARLPRALAAALLEAAGSQGVVFGFHDHDAISALLLGAVQRLVGQLNQSLVGPVAAGRMNAAPMLTSAGWPRATPRAEY